MRVDVHLARLDLGQVEDVVDQLEQVGAGAVDRLGELHLLGGEVAVGVVGQQLGQDQQAVERRAQLVRHVGQELGLVARGQRELLGPLLQRPAGLLDLDVLDLDVAVLLGQQRGLLLQLGVGALQLRCCACSSPTSCSSASRCDSEQLLGPGVGDDRVERDADGLDELVEEGQVHLGERRERGQLDHAEHLLLEQHRQHDHARPAGRSPRPEAIFM